jgi:photosystem II stability/assembly factor-like uncharacterized protein
MFDIDDTGDIIVSTRWTNTDGQEGPYISTDGGATWSRKVTGMTFGALSLTQSVCLARSSPNIMYASVSSSGYIYKSTDTGDKWTALDAAGARNWNGVKCNSSGTIVVAADSTGYLYKSTDSGASWSAMTGSTTPQWDSVWVSEDGSVIVGCPAPGNLRVSRDGGSTWSAITSIGTNKLWRGISGSADGTVLFASASATERSYLSKDSGVTWTQLTSFGSADNYWNTAVSINGNKLATAQAGGYVWVSQDGGTNWTQQTSLGTNVQSWEGLAMTPDGKKMIVGTQGSDKPRIATGT